MRRRPCYTTRVAAILPWLQQHWFDLAQTFGIIASVALTAASLRRDRRGRKMTDYLTLAGHHRELWSDANRRPELNRIFLTEVDLIARPISVMEEEFLNLVIVHFNSGWLMARDDGLIKAKSLAADAHAFFSLPIPHTVWERTTHFRDPEFVQFIEQALAPKVPIEGRSYSLLSWTRRLRRCWRRKTKRCSHLFL